MLFAFDLVQPIPPEALPLFFLVLGIGVVIAVLVLYLRDRTCRKRGHNFQEINSFPGGKDTVVIFLKCKRCGLKKYDEQNR